MAKLQKKPQEDHSNDWLATYSDMVTLLLTFFVMLYASSSLDEQKWQYIYQAFQSKGKYLNEYVDHPNHTTDAGSYVSSEDPSQAGGEDTQPQSFDKLYQFLSEYVETEDLSDAMSVSRDSAHIYIRFDSGVFFGGNSSELTTEGQEILNSISPAIKAVKTSIQTVTVSGHTAQGISAVNDWDLSTGRACSVVKYLEFKGTLDSSQFKPEGWGPNKPIADNSTEEGRAQNRRVEMTIVRNDLDFTDPEVVKDILRGDYGIDVDQIDPDAPNEDSSKLPDGSAEGIINSIESLFPGQGSSSVGGSSGPYIYVDEFESFLKTEETATDAGTDSNAAESDAE